MFEDVFKILDNAINLDEKAAFRFAVTDEIKELIIHLNTEIQLGTFGIDSEDDDLGDYSPFTIQKRVEKGLQTGHIDFNFTGEYWNSWRVKLVGDVIEIDVNDARFKELVEELNFSETHVGLTEENIDKIAREMVFFYRKFALDNILK